MRYQKTTPTNWYGINDSRPKVLFFDVNETLLDQRILKRQAPQVEWSSCVIMVHHIVTIFS
jgi:hypothetical protein